MLIHNKRAIIRYDNAPRERRLVTVLTGEHLEYIRASAAAAGPQYSHTRYYLATIYKLQTHSVRPQPVWAYGRDQYPEEDRLKLEGMPKWLTE
jgi:hypothetical protein